MECLHNPFEKGKNEISNKTILDIKKRLWDFPGSSVVKNPLASAGDMDLSPGPGRSHMPRSN